MNTIAMRVLEESGLGGTSHTVPLPLLEQTLLEQYGLSGELSRIPTELDATFKCRTPQDGREYLVKVSHPDEPLDVVRCQIEVVDHIERTDPGIPVQHIHQTRDGGLWTALTDPVWGFQGILRVQDFIPGALLIDMRPTPEQLRSVGAMLARVDAALRGFTHSGANREFAWNLTRFTQFDSLIELEPDAHRRSLARTVFSAFREVVDPKIVTARTQIIHGDFSPYNVVVDRDRPEFVVGVIDFGDVMRAPLGFDPAVMCGNSIDPDTDDPWVQARELLAGYRSIIELDKSELEIVALASLARITLRALIAAWRLSQDTERAEYVARHARDDWARLDRALQSGPSAARTALLKSAPDS